MPSHVHILGAGSIGCLFGYYFNKAGIPVTLIRRGNISDNTATITLKKNGEVFCTKLDQVEPMHTTKIDILLITTKTYDTQAALQSVAHAISDSTLLIICQNGIEHYQILKGFPKNAIYAAVCFEGVKKSSPLNIEHTGAGFTDLGALRTNKDDISLSALFHTELVINKSEEIEAIIWKKLVANSCINPLTVYFDCLNGDLLNKPSAIDYINQLINEALPVINSYNINLTPDTLKEYCINGIKKTARNSSSMREDVRHNRRTEIDSINAAIAAKAKKLEKTAKTHQHLVQIVRQRPL